MCSNKAEFSFLQKKTDQSKKEISWLCLLQDLRFAPFVFFGFVFKVQKSSKNKVDKVLFAHNPLNLC